MCCTVMLKYGKTCQNCAAVLHETPWELHFPYENGKEYMVQSLKSLKKQLDHATLFKCCVCGGGFFVALFLHLQTMY